MDYDVCMRGKSLYFIKEKTKKLSNFLKITDNNWQKGLQIWAPKAQVLNRSISINYKINIMISMQRPRQNKIFCIHGAFFKGTTTTTLCSVYTLYRFQFRLPEFNWDKVKSFSSQLKFPLKMSFGNQIRAPCLAYNSS